MKTRSLPLVLIFVFLLALAPAGAVAQPYSELVVFGDSLSDNGNLLFIPDQPAPDPSAYWRGHFSNGPVWVEYLSDPSHFNAPLTDRALGGAQTAGLVPPGLIEQVAAHIAVVGPPLSSNALFIIWIGGNDFLNGPGDFQSAVNNIEEAMTRLAESGAKHLLILNLPDLGQIPATLGTPEASQATAFTLNFNTGLANAIDSFSVAYPGIDFFEFDVNALFSQVRADPAAFGFVNVTEPSPNFSVPDNFDGAGYLFWDEIHPTTAMHQVVADRVFSDLSAQQVQPSESDVVAQADDDGGASCFIAIVAVDTN